MDQRAGFGQSGKELCSFAPKKCPLDIKDVKRANYSLIARLGRYWHWAVTVPLQDPVQFEPPPPLAPPMTNFLNGWPLIGSIPSGVPAGCTL
jgi:hypothetical protein